MATYVYTTIPQQEGEEPEQFEIQQSMRDAALTKHPVDGRPVKRMIVGGIGFIKAGTDHATHMGSCGNHCGCD